MAADRAGADDAPAPGRAGSGPQTVRQRRRLLAWGTGADRLPWSAPGAGSACKGVVELVDPACR